MTVEVKLFREAMECNFCISIVWMFGYSTTIPLKFSKDTVPEDIQNNKFPVVAEHEIHIRDHFVFFALMSLIINS
jgi:hypothetical protein